MPFSNRRRGTLEADTRRRRALLGNAIQQAVQLSDITGGTQGDIVKRGLTNWESLVISVPGAPTFNFLGVENGELEPTWKSASSNPGAAAEVLQTDAAGLLTLDALTVTNNIIVGGTVDGVDVANHSARHDVGGADALTTTSDAETTPNEILQGDANGDLRLRALGVGVATPGVAGQVQTNSGTTNDSVLVESTDSRSNVTFKDNATTAFGHVTVGAIGDDLMLRSSNSDRLRLLSGEVRIITPSDLAVEAGYLVVGGIASAVSTNMTLGETILQGANDDEAFNIQNTDVGAVYNIVDTNTFFTIQKVQGTSGGAQLNGFKDADGGARGALQLLGYLAEAPDTTKTTAGLAITEIFGVQTNGTSPVNTAANGNVFSVSTLRGGSPTALMIVDEDADLIMVGGTLSTTSGGTDAWQLHDYTGGTVTDTGYVEVTIDGTLYQLLARLPP